MLGVSVRSVRSVRGECEGDCEECEEWRMSVRMSVRSECEE